MTRDPIRRRFGKGSGRLRVGLPAAAARLSAIARRPIRYERRLTVVPVATAALIAWLLATSPLLHPPLAPAVPDAIQIVMQAPPARPERAPESAPEHQPRAAEQSRPASAQPSAARIARTERKPLPPTAAKARKEADRPTAGEPAPRPFDPTALATRAPRFDGADVLPAGSTSAPAPLPAAGRERGAQARGMPRDLASAARAATASPALSPTGAAALPAASAPLGERPGSGSATADPSAELVDTAHLGDRRRGEIVAALERSAAGARGLGAGSDAQARRPEVSARGSSAGVRALAASRDSRGSAVDGWQEVPLDALPDCTPAGRQDLLKKRILLAASLQRECSHASGSFRFVETRTLGGFLMWSRPNPGPSAGQPRDRDACDVLERALTCLGDRSSEESSSR
ncbi:MAG: hypothetical protein R3F21_01640 [Myxococcota bacterium]